MSPPEAIARTSQSGMDHSPAVPQKHGTKLELVNVDLRNEIIEQAATGGANLKNNSDHPLSFLTSSQSVAEALDAVDPLAHMRDYFNFPPKPDGSDALYFCGHSLGLQPKRTKEILDVEMKKWADCGVRGHMQGERPWVSIDEKLEPPMAKIVGAKRSEVCVMNTLTVNLHMLLVPFWRPEGDRKILLFEDRCFSSDYFAFCSFAQSRGWNVDEVVVPVTTGSIHLPPSSADIIQAIEKYGEKLSVVCIGAVQFFSGEYYEIEKIVKKCHAVGAKIVLDCAHAAGNVQLKLNEWNVDAACWCSYKYLNSGPGCLGSIFIHEKHHDQLGKNDGLPYLAGWFGVDLKKRFTMALNWPMREENNDFANIGANMLQISNPPIMSAVCILGSLEAFEAAGGMEKLVEKQRLITGYFEALLQDRLLSEISGENYCEILTPSDPAKRGCQLTLMFPNIAEDALEKVCQKIENEQHVHLDLRKPNVLRFAPVPLYCRFVDCWSVVDALREVLLG